MAEMPTAKPPNPKPPNPKPPKNDRRVIKKPDDHSIALANAGIGKNHATPLQVIHTGSPTGPRSRDAHRGASLVARGENALFGNTPSNSKGWALYGHRLPSAGLNNALVALRRLQ